MSKYIPVLLLTGYLGSGKTTLLNRILNNRRGIKFAVIVNDIGEVNIDAELIQKGGVVGQDNSDDLVALQNGCICCTLKMDLVKQLTDITSSQRFDYIVIEASGICEPAPIAQTICAMPSMAGPDFNGTLPRLDCIATVVDALRLESEFACGDSLQRRDIDDDDIENLIIQQIEFCNIILLNKISEVAPEQADRIRAIIRAIQPKAEIIGCDYCDIDLDRLLNTDMFDFEDVATSATWVRELEGISPADDDHHEHHHEHHEHEEGCDGGEHCHCHHHHDEGEAEEYGIQTFVYFRRKPFDLNRFDYFCDKHWPTGIIRTKGVVYFAENTDMSYLFEQAGVQKKLQEAGYWYATAPDDELRRMMAADPQLAADWDPEYGDRMIKLVIIGQHLDRHAIETALDKCIKA
ncbi:MAG: GTP-binding protein [Bacteroidales bacterium]|nr:GTP-binding protein [Bacteroidales bacterium]